MKDPGSLAEIEIRLAAVRARIRRVLTVRGSLRVGAVLLGGLLVVMACDLMFAPLPRAARWILSLAWVATTGWTLIGTLRESLRPIGLLRIARWLEQRHPEFEERISTSMQLRGDESVPPGLLAALIEAADLDARQLQPGLEVRAGTATRRWKWAMACLLLVFATALVIQPSTTLRLIARATAPHSDLGNAGAESFVIFPGDLEVFEDEAIEISASYSGKSAPEIVLATESNVTIAQPMRREQGKWIFRLEPARESFRYHLSAGRDQSDSFEARVWPHPRLLEPVVRLEFPAYTDLPATTAPLGTVIRAVVGTRIAIEGGLNTPLASAQVTFADAPPSSIPGRIEAGSSGARLGVEFAMAIGLAGEASLTGHHRLGRDSELARFRIDPLADQAPEVAITRPTPREITVRPDETLRIAYRAREDFGLGSVYIEVAAGKSAAIEFPANLPEKSPATNPGAYLGEATLAVGAVREQLDGTREFHVRIAATDRRGEDFGGPQVGRSEWLIVRLDDGARSLARQTLEAQHDATRQAIEEALRQTREGEQKIQENRWRIEQQLDPENAERISAEATDKLAEARKTLADLALEAADGIHAKQVPAIAEAAKAIEQAAASFESAPLRDEQDQRQMDLELAVASTREAVQKLEEIRNQLDQANPAIQDLARMEELAQRQQELARQAENVPSTEMVPEDWKHRQEQVRNQLQEEVRQRPDALARALEAQAAAARDLAVEAREISRSQEQLATASGAEEQRANEPEPVVEELASAAGEQAGNLKPNESPAATELDAKALQEAIAQRQEQAAAEVEAAAEIAAVEPQEMAAERADDLRNAAVRARAAVDQLRQDEAQGAAENLRQAAAAIEKANPGTESAALADTERALASAAQALSEGDLPKAADELAAAEAIAEEAKGKQLERMLAAEQAGIAHQAREQLSDARKELSPFADQLPAAAQAASDAQAALEGGATPEAAEATAKAAETLKEIANNANAPESAENGEQAGNPAEPSVADSPQAAAIENLAERQQDVAQAAAALAEGRQAEALATLEKMNAEQAAKLANELRAQPELGSDALGQPTAQAARGEDQAGQASGHAESGEFQPASDQNHEAAKSFAQTAAGLEEAAARLDREAAEAAARAANQPPPGKQAPLGAEALAAALAQSAAATNPQPGEAAGQSAAAAESLAQAAAQARSQMQGQPGQPGQPGQSQPGGMPGPADGQGEESLTPDRQAQPDPGVPPRLARLGIGAADWEKIQESLKADISGNSSTDVPDDYKSLVKDYFQSMSQDQ